MILDKKYKRGHVREDGMVFMGYTNKSKNEWWSTSEHLEREKQRCRKSVAKIRNKNPQYQKNYYNSNRQTLCKKAQEYRKKNPEKIKLQWVQYRKNNKEKIINGRRRYAKKYPEKINAKASRKRAMLKNALHPDHKKEHDKFLAHLAKILKPFQDLHVDHIVPLARGGSHHISNLRLLPAKINISKREKLDSEMSYEIQQDCNFWKTLTQFLFHSYEHNLKIN